MTNTTAAANTSTTSTSTRAKALRAHTTAARFAAALRKVESESIREWANSAHNRPLFLEWVKSHPELDALDLSTRIVILAMGL